MPLQEAERIAAVSRYMNLNLSLERELQDIVDTACQICGTPTALITFITEDTQFIRFKKAFKFDQTPRSQAFCNYTIAQKGVFLVEDTHQDQRFIAHPLVTGDPRIRFYAGAPLVTQDGYHLGSLCIIDQKPGSVSALQTRILTHLARQVIQLLEYDASVALLKQQYAEALRMETQMRSFFESSTSEHVMIDSQLKIVAFNKRVQEFIQKVYHVSMQAGMDVTNFIHRDYITDFIANCQRALKGETVSHERLVVFGETAHWCAITYDPSRNAQGEIVGVSYHSTDITDQMNDQTLISSHEQLLSKTAFIQSHELRKPVANMLGLLTLIETGGQLSHVTLLKDIEENVRLLDEHIQMIVRYTDVNRHKDSED